MHWPRGKYNGKRIGGLVVRFDLNVLRWRRWKVLISEFRPVDWPAPCTYGLVIFAGPVRLWIDPSYER